MKKFLPCTLAVVALSTLGLGCDDDPPSGTPDAGVEWDGKYVPLAELGDNIDTGPLSACATTTGTDGGPLIACGSPESFNLSSCNLSTLSRLSPSGVYALRTRFSGEFFGYGSGYFQISATGGREAANTYPLVQKQVDGQSFYVASQRTLTDGGTTLWAYAGCVAPNSQRFSGCYQTCTNGGARRSSGTFDAVRVQRVNEPETSNISLVSERRVELGLPVDVYVAKNHAYVVSLTVGRNTPNPVGGVTVFDVSDKANPVFRKVVTLDGDIYWNSVWSKGDALYVGSGNHGVLVFDITDPADPKMVRYVPGDAFDVHTLFVDGDRLYAQASGANQVLIFDVSKPLEPVLLNRYTVPSDDNGLGYPHDSFAYQNRLYLNQMGQGYYVVDVTDPANLKPLGSYTYDAELYNPTHANAVGTFGGKTIAFEGGESVNAHLRVLDVTDPAHIVKIGEYAMRPQTSIHNMVLVGKRLYVAWYAEGLRVLDVSNPTQLKEIAYANTYKDSDVGFADGLFTGAIGIRVPGDGFVYVVDMTRGLLIYREP